MISLPGPRACVQRGGLWIAVLTAGFLGGAAPAQPEEPARETPAVPPAEDLAKPDLTGVPTVRWLPSPHPVLGSEAKEEAGMKAYAEVLPGTRVTFEMVPIRGGRLTMGSPAAEKDRRADEGPQHEVRIEPFWIGKLEVTWDEYSAFAGQPTLRRPVRTRKGFDPGGTYCDAVSGPSEVPYVDPTTNYGGSGYPAVCATHLAAAVFCKWLSGQTGRYYRLPTEAEWEYACRAGTKTVYSFGDDPKDLEHFAWYYENSEERPHRVGTRRPNPWGLFDMHGNAAEWVLDQYVADFYRRSGGKGVTAPLAVPTTTYPCVIRGGSWDDDAEVLRSAARSKSSKRWDRFDPRIPPGLWMKNEAYCVGFRVLRPLRVPTLRECRRLEGWIGRELAAYRQALSGKEKDPPSQGKRPSGAKGHPEPNPLLDPAAAWLPEPYPVANAETGDQAGMKPYTEVIPGSDVKFEMVPIRGGTFLMGSPPDEKGRKPDEGPQHRVRVDPFWMGKHEVTWDEYELWGMTLDRERRLMRKQEPTQRDLLADAITRVSLKPYTDPTFGMGKEGYPAILMTQLAAKLYCKWLSAKTGRYYRLPTEGEWEYACRAGTKTAYSFGDDPQKLGEFAWYYDNGDERYHKVGQKKPNPWGLHDMHGNVAEWVADQYVPDLYRRRAATTALNPFVPVRTVFPCPVRGGSWADDPPALRSAARRASSKQFSEQDPQVPKSLTWHTDSDFVGFRVVRPLRVPTVDESRRLEVNRRWIEDFPDSAAGGP